MSEEPDVVIDSYLAISLDSLVLICEEGKVFHVISVFLLYLMISLYSLLFLLRSLCVVAPVKIF